MVSVRIYSQKHETISRKPGELLGRRSGRYRGDGGERGRATSLTILTRTIKLPLSLRLLSRLLVRLKTAESAQLLNDEVGSSAPIGSTQSS